MKEKTPKKIKLFRIVTHAKVVSWHLKNFIERSENDYKLFIIGNEVSRLKDYYPNVIFIDVKILRKTSPFNDFKALIILFVLFIKIRPHIIHSIMPKAGFLSSIAGFFSFVPVRIHTFTGQVWASKNGTARWFYKSMDKLIFRMNSICLTDSPSQSNFLAENGFLVAGNFSIDCLGKGSLSGVDFGRFNVDTVKNKNQLRLELGLSKDDFVYVYLARKSIIKGIRELIESFAKVEFLNNTKLLFIGPDESDGELDILLKTHGSIRNKIINLDIVQNHQNYLAISDVLCLPSSSEGFGSIVIEAAALGVPAIGFDIVGLSDSIEHEYSGILVPFKNVDLFSKAMIDLYNDKAKLEKLKFNGRKRALEYFSADKIYSLQKQFYKSQL